MYSTVKSTTLYIYLFGEEKIRVDMIENGEEEEDEEERNNVINNGSKKNVYTTSVNGVFSKLSTNIMLTNECISFKC